MFVSNKLELCAIFTFIPFDMAIANQNSQHALPASAKFTALCVKSIPYKCNSLKSLAMAYAKA